MKIYLLNYFRNFITFLKIELVFIISVFFFQEIINTQNLYGNSVEKKKICLKNEIAHYLPREPFYVNKISNHYCLTLHSLNEAGFFAIFNSVLGLIDHFNNSIDPNLHAVSVNFAKNSFYYDSLYGENFWEYFFEPLFLSNPHPIWAPMEEILVADTIPYCSQLTRPIQAPYLSYKGFSMDRSKAFAIINQHIKIKKHILEKIDNYTKEHFSGEYIIAIHYRGTDKKIESPRVDYKKIEDALYHYIKENELTEYKIFIATDELAFLDTFLKKFPNKILFTLAERSTNNQAVHKSNYSPYSKGEEALIDCLLLSKCDFLFWTESCLSLNATRFNPKLSNIKISN